MRRAAGGTTAWRRRLSGASAALALSWIAAVGVASEPSHARAFIEADRFAAPALEGGGGGLRFTGALADPRTCGVCHEGGPARALALEGLPAPPLEPGRAYAIVLDASAAARSAFALEVTGGDAPAVGTLEAPDAASLPPEERCSNGEPAVRLVELEGGRRVAVADACGARRYRVLWTPPPGELDREATLHGGLVLADDSGSPAGDTALVIEEPIGPGARRRPVAAESGCTTGGSGGSRPGARPSGAALSALAALLVLRRRRGARPGSRSRRAG